MMGIRTVTVRTNRAGALKISASLPGEISLFLRSFLFLTLYFFFTFNYLSVITIIPIFLILILIFSVALLSRRENLNQLDSSLDNILKIEQIK